MCAGKSPSWLTRLFSSKGFEEQHDEPAVLIAWDSSKLILKHHIDRTLQLIHNEGCKAGLVFNPATPLDYLDYVIDKVDMVLLMSVNPGFGGQSFIESSFGKIRAMRAKLDEYEARSGRAIRLEVDGGIKTTNIAEVAKAGADTFVAGSAVFGMKDPQGYEKVISAMKQAVEAVR